jgi:hypothetical protein
MSEAEQVVKVRYLAITMMLIACGVLLGACSKPEYWVKGLTLPSGSKVVKVTDKKAAPAERSQILPGSIIKRTLIVEFSNPCGWDAVCAHFKSCLIPAGFTENLDPRDSDRPAIGAPGFKYSDMARGYISNDKIYTIVITNTNAFISYGWNQGSATSGVNADVKASASYYDFSLIVDEVKK